MPWTNREHRDHGRKEVAVGAFAHLGGDSLRDRFLLGGRRDITGRLVALGAAPSF